MHTCINAQKRHTSRHSGVQAFRNSGIQAFRRAHTHTQRVHVFLRAACIALPPFCNNFRMARNCRQDRRSGTLKTFLDSCELPSFMVMISTFLTVDVLKLAYFINLKLLCEHRACSRCKAVEKMRLFDVQQVGDRLRRLKDIHHPMISGVLDARLNFSAAIFPVPSFHGFDLHSIQRAKGHKTTYDSVSLLECTSLGRAFRLLALQANYIANVWLCLAKCLAQPRLSTCDGCCCIP